MTKALATTRVRDGGSQPSGGRATPVRGRRGHGEGSIYPVAGGNRSAAGASSDERGTPVRKWRAVVDLGWVEGKRSRKYVTGATRTEVAGKLRQLQHAVDQGRTPGREVTVEAHLTRWVAESLPGRVAEKAIENYSYIARVHLVPALGKRKLSALTPVDVEKMLNAKLAAGLSVSTVRRIRSVLVQSLRQAERWGLVARNVAGLVDPPKVVSDEARSLTLAESKRLLVAAVGTRLETAVTLLLSLGMRRGELLGLRWDDVDLDVGVLRVRRALGQVNGRASIVEVKTAKSRRALNLAPPVLEALRRHRVTQAAERLAALTWTDSGHVFAATNGAVWHPRNFSRDFARLVTAAGLDAAEVHPHTLRHGATSQMLAAGVPVDVVMSVLGHATARMTLGTYSHVEQPQREAAAETMAAALFG